MGDQNELGVLWKKISKQGNEYFSGKITINGQIREIIIFYITKRKNKSPYFKIIESRYGNNGSGR